jgi:putative ABC transport system permease protein
MLKNYFNIAFRNFKSQPGYTFLNIFGLTLGIAATLFILLYITEESRYDTHHEKADRIYRVSTDITEPDDHFRWSSTQIPLASTLKQDYPEVEEYVRFIDNGRTSLEYKDRFYFEEKVFLVDSTVCDIFTFNFIKGDAETALLEPNSITLNESVSKRIFGNNNPIGEVLKTVSGREYKVTGVYEDMPLHSHLIADAMISANSNQGFMNPDPGNWGGFNLYTYVLLKEGTNANAFAQKLPEVVEKYVATIFDQFDIKIKYELLPLTSIHLTSDFEGEPEPVGQIGFLYIFGIVAFFILLIACINFMNLSTARATKRSLEVGIRKVLGSERRQLIGQFLAESILFTFFAIVLSYLLVLFLLPLFNQTFDLSLSRSLLWSNQVLLGLLGIAILTGVLGGSYPAFYLSSFEPIKVLKGTLAKGAGNPKFRKVLVSVQFAITIFMIIGTGIIFDQMNYLRNKDLGFDKEHILTFNIQGRSAQAKLPVLQSKLLQYPKITSIGTSTTTPGDGFGKALMNVEKQDGGMEQYGVDLYGVDYDFFPTLDVEMVAGRNFSRDYGTDTTSAVMINEAMVKRFGWDDAIGKKFQFGTNDTLPFLKVIGVVKDFHQSSLYDPISPLLFFIRRNNPNVHVRMKPSSANELSQTISKIEQEWSAVFPNAPFEYNFVDESFMDLYQSDQIRANIFTLFSVLMVLIACLGLLGLAAFSAEQRTKEIGIRKIMGARTTDIVYLLTRDFVFLVTLASIPAFIVAWYFMSKWLDTFAYHTSMNYLFYLLAFIAVALITLLTTGYHALQVANSNPINALKQE